MATKLFCTRPSLGTLHEEYAKKSRIDEEAPVTSTASILIDAPPSQVWAVLADVAGWPSWHAPMTVLSLGEVCPDAVMRWKLGATTIRSTFAVVDPERELTWTGRVLGFKAVDQHLLEPAGDGRSMVTTRESLAGPLLPLLFSPARLHAQHQQWLTDLKTRVEQA